MFMLKKNKKFYDLDEFMCMVKHSLSDSMWGLCAEESLSLIDIIYKTYLHSLKMGFAQTYIASSHFVLFTYFP